MLGSLKDGNFACDNTIYPNVLEAYKKGEKICYAREISVDSIIKNGKKILTTQFGYDEDELTTPTEIFDAYKIAYTEDLKTNVWYVDIEELASHGITLHIPDSTLRLIAAKAYKLHTGARSLSAIFDEVLEPEINAIVDQLDEGSVKTATIEVAEEEMVKRLERCHGN